MFKYRKLVPGVITLSISLLFFSSFTPVESNISSDVLKYTNDYRKSKGLPALTMKTDLNALAQKHSENMAKGKTAFGHSGYDQRASKVKKMYNTCDVAENVAYGASNAKEAVTLWKNSSGHRKNMLGKYKYVGIGTAKNSRGILYYTVLYVN